MPHHHHGADPGEQTFQAKMKIRLAHWIKHNDDHTAEYREWAQKAAAAGLAEVGRLLDEVAQMSAAMSDQFNRAVRALNLPSDDA